MDINRMDFVPVNVEIKKENLDNLSVLKVVKSNKIMEFDENTYAKLSDLNFHNGIIEVKLFSKLLPDAPDFARGFIGVAFRINDDDTRFESFYVRPTNGRCEDPIRKKRAIQYFSYPGYTFDYFRENEITSYEGEADIDLEEWIDLKIFVKNAKAQFYVNQTLVLCVDDLKLGDTEGFVGLFVDVGTEGYFKDLKITNL